MVQSLSIEFERLTSLCLNGDGNLLACDAGARHIKVIDPNGRLAGTIPLEFGPQAIDRAKTRPSSDAQARVAVPTLAGVQFFRISVGFPRLGLQTPPCPDTSS